MKHLAKNSTPTLTLPPIPQRHQEKKVLEIPENIYESSENCNEGLAETFASQSEKGSKKARRRRCNGHVEPALPIFLKKHKEA